MNKCAPFWREAHVQVKMYRTHENRPFSEHFWKLRCRKRGAKHVSKWKCTRHTIVGNSFGSRRAKQILSSKRTIHTSSGPRATLSWHVEKCTRRWCKANLQGKSAKSRPVGAFLTFRCRFAWQGHQGFGTCCHKLGLCSIFKHRLHYSTRHYMKVQYITLHHITCH